MSSFPDFSPKKTYLWFFLAGIFMMVTGDFPRHPFGLESKTFPLLAISWSKLYLVLLNCSFLLFIFQRGLSNLKTEALRVLWKPLSALTGSFLVSVIFSEWHYLSLETFGYFLAVLFFLYMFSIFLEREIVLEEIWILAAFAILFLAVRVIWWRLDEGMYRGAYLVLNNNWAGKIQITWVLNFFAPLLLAMSFKETGWRARVFGVSWIMSGIAVYMTLSRAGINAFLFSTVLLFSLHLKSWKKWVPIAGIVAALLGWTVANSLHVSGLVVKDTAHSFSRRTLIWKDSLRMFKDHPLTGIGLGTYDETAFSRYGAPYDSEPDQRFYRGGWHAHSVYLHILAESGILGFLAWIYLLYAYLNFLAGRWKEGGSEDSRSIACAFIASFLAFLILAVFENLLAVRVHQSLRMNLTLGFLVCLGVAGLRPSLNGGQMLRSP